MKRNIGFLGLGKMGKGVCHNLILAGNDVSVFDTNQNALEQFEGQAYLCASPDEAFERSEVTFLSLPNSDVVEKVMEGFFKLGVEGKLVVDISTSYPISTRALYERMKAQGGAFVDGPLLAGPKEAWSGTLTTALGGDEQIITRYADLFASYTSQYEYVGKSGNGHLIKLAQNWAGLVQAIMYAQIYPVIEKHGIPAEKLYDLLNTDFFANWFFEVYSKKYIAREYKPAFALELGLKDLSYMKRLCDELNVPGFLIDGAMDLCRVTLKEHRDQNKYADMSSVCETVYQYVGL